MARRKGQTMTEEQKAAMRARRQARKTGKETAYTRTLENLKLLSFDELEGVIAFAHRYKKDQMAKEELKLIKAKEEIDLKLKALKNLEL
ncbi:hypothetical protein [Parabacteroides sp. PF5-9]|uniref:hypothetical protein n=1 Tax=Parabacteroides sp. PF5-9 TaxID=1742404 RepID=UPI002475BBA9|nr:hypothetical protein [Parabacteroides sp. PF5-9]MDH6358067.1 hypothetical protein [Parabacteroides sp. PF5-9]